MAIFYKGLCILIKCDVITAEINCHPKGQQSACIQPSENRKFVFFWPYQYLIEKNEKMYEKWNLHKISMFAGSFVFVNVFSTLLNLDEQLHTYLFSKTV